MCCTPPGTAVGGAQPYAVGGGPPRAAGTGLQVQRPELIGADHPPVRWRVVIKVQHPAHLGHEVRIGGGFQGLGGLPSDPARVQDLPDALPAHHGHTSGGQVIGELA
jgi:hypothetical protein